MVEVTVHTQQDTEAAVVSSVEEMVEVVSPAEMVDAEEVVEEMEAAAAAAAAVVRRHDGVIWDWRFLVYHLGIW